MAVKPIPEGYHSVTPYLSIKGAARALDFYKQAFGATELLRMDGPNGTIAHAEIRIGDSPIMLSDEAPNMVCASPDTLQATSVGLMIYVPNVDAVFANALKAGLDVRQECVLLAFVEAVNLVDKHDGVLGLQAIARRLRQFHGFANFLDAAEHSTDGQKLRIKGIGHQAGGIRVVDALPPEFKEQEAVAERSQPFLDLCLE